MKGMVYAPNILDLVPRRNNKTCLSLILYNTKKLIEVS